MGARCSWVVAGGVVAGLIAGGPAAAQGTQADPQSFDYTGSTQSYTVPATTSVVKIVATGGGGQGGDIAEGGAGAVVTTYQQVTPGQTLTVKVGGGGSAQACGAAGAATAVTSSTGPTVIVVAGGGGAAGEDAGGSGAANHTAAGGDGSGPNAGLGGNATGNGVGGKGGDHTDSAGGVVTAGGAGGSGSSNGESPTGDSGAAGGGGGYAGGDGGNGSGFDGDPGNGEAGGNFADFTSQTNMFAGGGGAGFAGGGGGFCGGGGGGYGGGGGGGEDDQTVVSSGGGAGGSFASESVAGEPETTYAPATNGGTTDDIAGGHGSVTITAVVLPAVPLPLPSNVVIRPEGTVVKIPLAAGVTDVRYRTKHGSPHSKWKRASNVRAIHVPVNLSEGTWVDVQTIGIAGRLSPITTLFVKLTGSAMIVQRSLSMDVRGDRRGCASARLTKIEYRVNGRARVSLKGRTSCLHQRFAVSATAPYTVWKSVTDRVVATPVLKKRTVAQLQFSNGIASSTLFLYRPNIHS